jgi:hypothetical protein
MIVIGDKRVRPWLIEWSGYTWTDDNAGLTAADICNLQILVANDWGSINPWASPLHLASMIAVLAGKATDTDPLELLPLVHATPAEVFIGAIRPREVT